MKQWSTGKGLAVAFLIGAVQWGALILVLVWLFGCGGGGGGTEAPASPSEIQQVSPEKQILIAYEGLEPITNMPLFLENAHHTLQECVGAEINLDVVTVFRVGGERVSGLYDSAKAQITITSPGYDALSGVIRTWKHELIHHHLQSASHESLLFQCAEG